MDEKDLSLLSEQAKRRQTWAKEMHDAYRGQSTDEKPKSATGEDPTGQWVVDGALAEAARAGAAWDEAKLAAIIRRIRSRR